MATPHAFARKGGSTRGGVDLHGLLDSVLSGRLHVVSPPGAISTCGYIPNATRPKCVSQPVYAESVNWPQRVPLAWRALWRLALTFARFAFSFGSCLLTPAYASGGAGSGLA
jgi:hypothetical protein